MTLTAKELSGTHIGKRVTFPNPALSNHTVRAEIYSIEHRGDQTKIRMPNHSWYWVPTDHPITIQEEQ
jgi:hypothetical protein